ncbi:hypothetical protein K2173_012986 [Erythroxylum novogranatense]|uniref:Glycosyltransferase n=1 Tax=Erythroxylum novogranatense TaxID=1862640 RepID=A0AAV8S7H6_9ROSI|nr:hypothetical protein K2173_012986 [Erythroxylum novogranatense]
MENKSCHVIVLTYPAQGHINPLLQFAKLLPISDGFDEGGFKQASSVEAYLESFKAVGSRTLAQLINKFDASDSPVRCIVYDSLLPWALEVAKEFGIYAATFLTNSASLCSLYWHIVDGLFTLPVNPEIESLSLPGLPVLAFHELPSFLAYPTSHSAYLAVVMEKFYRLTENDWVFCNSFEELESELVKAMKGLWPVKMIGPMVPSAYLDQQIEGDTAYGASLWEPTTDRCLKWLETKPSGSVLYVSFGSMASVSDEQVQEIAWGLKASNRPFMWVLKGSENKLPGEFMDSIGETGLVVTWCNQLQVLAHKAVGCFVTHCGWNSILEALSFGVPMVCVAQGTDQPTNAKFVEDIWKVGVRAKRNEEGILTRKELYRCISQVMEGESSRQVRGNTKKWTELAKKAVSRGGSSDRNISEFLAKVTERNKA